MEPIEPFGGANFRPNNREKRVEKRSARRIAFSSVFSSASEGAETPSGASFIDLASDTNLEEMLDRVHDLGDKVREGATFANIHEYKEAVRAFLAYVIKHTLAIEQQESGVNILKRKRFTLIKVIDQKLEKFAADILSNQREQLEILRRLDEINGLLVDLLS